MSQQTASCFPPYTYLVLQADERIYTREPFGSRVVVCKSLQHETTFFPLRTNFVDSDSNPTDRDIAHHCWIDEANRFSRSFSSASPSEVTVMLSVLYEPVGFAHTAASQILLYQW
jgi:hypothetical protein